MALWRIGRLRRRIVVFNHRRQGILIPGFGFQITPCAGRRIGGGSGLWRGGLANCRGKLLLADPDRGSGHILRSPRPRRGRSDGRMHGFRGLG